jgi:hypothetical protein
VLAWVGERAVNRAFGVDEPMYARLNARLTRLERLAGEASSKPPGK